MSDFWLVSKIRLLLWKLSIISLENKFGSVSISEKVAAKLYEFA